MNIPKAIVFAVFVSLAAASWAQDTVPVKHALVVAISDYEPGSGFRHIFAGNDVKVITKLIAQQGFEDTIVLRDSRAGKQNFLDAFSLLRSRVHPGDVVFIQFSTHGQQIQDMNGDEADGLDEAIALYDARSSCTDGYKGQHHLTDDEFGSMIEQLRKDLGSKGDILVMVDACHSGTITRGTDTANIRGGYPPLMLTEEAGKLTRGVASEDEKVGMFCTTENTGDAGKANYVIFSACENSEVSSEYYYKHNYFGPLTWAFLWSMLNNTGENYTYSKLFHDIQYKMFSMFEACNTTQHPTMESAGQQGSDKVIFGGRNIAQQPYFNVTRIEGSALIHLQGGTISGLFDSTAFSVYPSGTPDPGKAGTPLARGVVIRTGYMESVARIDTPLSDNDPGNYWVFADRRTFGGYRINVGIAGITDPLIKAKINEAVKQCPFVIVTGEDPLFVIRLKKESPDRLAIEYGTTRKVCKDNIPVDALGDVLLTLARSQFLKGMQASAPGIRLEVSFLPVDTANHSTPAFIDPQTLRYTFRENKDTALLRIFNAGTKSVWFNILDIDPEEKVSVLVPSQERPVSECFLKPGQSFIVANTFGKPYGTEILKIIAADRQFDLRPAISSAGPTRGAPPVPDYTAVATYNLFFDVTK